VLILILQKERLGANKSVTTDRSFCHKFIHSYITRAMVYNAGKINDSLQLNFVWTMHVELCVRVYSEHWTCRFKPTVPTVALVLHCCVRMS